MRRTQINYVSGCENIVSALSENYISHGHYVQTVCMSGAEDIDFKPREGFTEVIFIESPDRLLIGDYKSGRISECSLNDLLYE